MNGFLKNVLDRRNRNTKTVKNILETIKKKAKKTYYPNKLLTCTNDIKNMEYYEIYDWKIKN